MKTVLFWFTRYSQSLFFQNNVNGQSQDHEVKIHFFCNWYGWKGLVTRKAHVKHKTLNLIAKVKVVCNRQTDKQPSR